MVSRHSLMMMAMAGVVGGVIRRLPLSLMV